MLSWSVVAPPLLPLAGALLATLLGQRVRAQRRVAVCCLVLLLACTCSLLSEVARCGSVRMALGNWQAPFGVEFVADGLSAVMTVVTAVIGIIVLLFQMSAADPSSEEPSTYPLVLTLMSGVGGSFVTCDLFNLYVWFEVMLLSALGLLALQGRKTSLDATLKYFVLNALGTLLFLVGIAHVYGATGHLNFGALARAASGSEAAQWLPLTITLALAFLVKAAAFPVFSWLPASYHTLSAPMLALFAALLTKVGIYALLRIFGDILPLAPRALFEGLGWIGVATMFVGALGAAYHFDMRRILAFHIVSQIGYLLLGVALGTSAGALATTFFLLHNILAKTNLLLIAAIVFRLTGSYDLRRCGGLYAARPALSVIFLISALAMVGIPPLSGFWAKFLLVRETLALGHWVWTGAALMTGLLTLYSMMKIWFEAFWKKNPKEGWEPKPCAPMWQAHIAVGTLAGLIVLLGIAPSPLLEFLQSSTRMQNAAELALDGGMFLEGISNGR